MLRATRLALAVVLAVAVAACGEFRYRADSYRAQSSPSSAPTVYVVQRGDTLYSIAWRYGLDFRTVARWNGVRSPYTIYPGQKLRLRRPPRSRSTASAAKPAASASSTAQRSKSHTAARKAPSARKTKSERTASGAPKWQWPATGPITHDFKANGSGKKGITVGGRVGAPIHAAAAGRIVYSGNGLRGYGNLVIVKHDSQYLTAYGYNRELLVKEGDRVRAGQVIARMGLGPERKPGVHFEIRRDGRPVDPLDYLPSR
ncbi:MAG: peptidoglycan DD-metalloendopeptidase family protein [Ectothiorhodospiraceae bacterium]|jgi:lipoprotein NlpD